MFNTILALLLIKHPYILMFDKKILGIGCIYVYRMTESRNIVDIFENAGHRESSMTKYHT